MSLEFIDEPIPCSECIVRPTCKNKPTFDYNVYKRCLLVPEFDQNTKIYKKGITECCINLLKIICGNINMLNDVKGTINKNNETKYINKQLYVTISNISNILQYIINSRSWRDGDLHNFDKIEIEKKLKNIHLYLNYK